MGSLDPPPSPIGPLQRAPFERGVEYAVVFGHFGPMHLCRHRFATSVPVGQLFDVPTVHAGFSARFGGSRLRIIDDPRMWQPV